MSSLLQTVRAVAWSFIGIRKNSGYQQDLSALNPFHIIVVAHKIPGPTADAAQQNGCDDQNKNKFFPGFFWFGSIAFRHFSCRIP